MIDPKKYYCIIKTVFFSAYSDDRVECTCVGGRGGVNTHFNGKAYNIERVE